MWLGREGLRDQRSQPGTEKKKSGGELLGSLTFMPGSASQLQQGEMEFKTPSKKFFLGLNIV